MFGLLRRQMCFWVYFIVTIPAWMSVYVTSPEAVWALRPRGKPPPCMPQLHARLVSFDLWTATRLIHTTAGWRPVPRRGCRAGRHVSKQRVTSVSVSSLPSRRERQIPVIVGRRLLADRPPTTSTVGHRRSAATRRCRRHASSSSTRQSVLRAVPLCRRAAQQVADATFDAACRSAPSLYLLNVAALTKPHAIEQLATDLHSYNADVAIITETHLKSKHTDSVVAVPGYTLLRRDRERRRGGGVALYVRSSLPSSVWTFSDDDRTYELLWACIDNTYVGALYHPPRPQYPIDSLLDYVESCVAELTHDHPTSTVVLAGDFNQLPHSAVVERTGFTQLVHQPTRGQNVLDLVFASNPLQYSIVRVVTSTVKSDHKAVVLYAESHPAPCVKSVSKKTFRNITPNQHALFLEHISEITFHILAVSSDTVQSQFDYFYSFATDLLNQFYPLRTITVTSRDPDFVTPAIKAKLRHKNRLMRRGRVDEAGALAQRIGKDIVRQNRSRLSKLQGKADVKDVWAAVRQLTSHDRRQAAIDGVDAHSLNAHFASISTDRQYTPPPHKLSVTHSFHFQSLTEWRVFHVLDTLRPTSTGLDHLPAWFLRLGAPFFYKPLTHLFNLSLATSTVPHQWKQVSICPVNKIPAAKTHSDFRPISITPVLTRVIERIVVRDYIYPALLNPPPLLSFTDQFAFRPSGSTTAALITILHTVTNLLTTNQFVVIIALDFSKAFDTVRHSSLLNKYSQMDIPDHIYNWLVDYFHGHSHCTNYRGQTSALRDISASIIQGSAIGPASYVVTAADLCSVTPGNSLCKYADDTYIIIPEVNVRSRVAEIDNVEAWSRLNNLQLNRKKCVEIVFTSSRTRHSSPPPPPLTDIARVSSLKILGVTVSSRLSVADHVQNVISSCAQTLHALRLLRAHGLCDAALQTVYRAVVVARSLYAASAWWGFTTAADRQRIEGFLRRGVRAGYRRAVEPTAAQMVEDTDDKLFHMVQYAHGHLLQPLLPNRRTHSHALRNRRHDFSLSCRLNALTDSNFITRQLFKNSY